MRFGTVLADFLTKLKDLQPPNQGRIKGQRNEDGRERRHHHAKGGVAKDV